MYVQQKPVKYRTPSILAVTSQSIVTRTQRPSPELVLQHWLSRGRRSSGNYQSYKRRQALVHFFSTPQTLGVPVRRSRAGAQRFRGMPSSQNPQNPQGTGQNQRRSKQTQRERERERERVVALCFCFFLFKAGGNFFRSSLC